MRLKSINFPNELIQAIRAEKLVVFAGAGVSMGQPAQLPSFSELADYLVTETGEQKLPSEPDDRFIGRLHRGGSPVHSLVADKLKLARGLATKLHHDLLRLFQHVLKVKVITTNFDNLFEDASKILFNEIPECYLSPALPRGDNFTGIVHVHGHIVKSTQMVLTDADFGRAYLTEGWARRFLLDLFRSHIVLFVGYSYDDVVMHYLSRALPADDSAKKFALVSADANLDEWRSRGIFPITFTKPSTDDYSALNDGIAALADCVSQNILDRKKSLVAVASGMPPSDDEGIDQLLDALLNESTTRFFIGAAKEPAWIDWLDSKNSLEGLFTAQKLSAVDELLATWLCNTYALQHQDHLIRLISRHRMTMNPWFWFVLCREISLNKEAEIDQLTISKWTSIVLHTATSFTDGHGFLFMAERCADLKDINSLFLIFSAMVSQRLEAKEGFDSLGEDSGQDDKIRFDVDLVFPTDHWILNELYTKQIKPYFVELSGSVLSFSIKKLVS